MRKSIYAIALAFLFSFVGQSHLHSQCTTYFYDGFESGVLGPAWLFGTGSYTRTITSASSAVGTYSFQHSSSTSGSFYQGTYTVFTPGQPNYMSWWMKTDNTTGANGYVVIGNSNIASDNGIIFCYFNASSGLRFFNSTGYNHPITANTWYHVEVKNMNWTSRNCDIWVNGALILPGWAFRSTTATNIDRIHLHSLVAANVVYDEFLIGTPAPSILADSLVMPACNGDSTGAIELTTSPGTGASTFLWSTGDTLEDISGLPAGTYTVVMTDGAGCTDADTLTLTEPTALAWADSTLDVSCHGDSSGAIDLFVSGGTPGYTFLWSGGQTTEDISGIPAGSYTVAITDTNGCVASDTIYIFEPFPFGWSDSLAMPACNGDSSGAIFLYPYGGTPGYTFTWSTGDSTSFISSLGVGTYDFTITDTLGCSLTSSYTVTEPTALLLATSSVGADSGAGTGFVDISMTGGTPPYSYAWSNGASTEDVDSLTPGTYVVTVTDSLGCTYTDSFFVDLFVGTNMGNAASDITVWPNPFTDGFTLQLPAGYPEASITLTDLQGRMLMEKNVAGQTLIEIAPSVSTGIYLLRVTTAASSTLIRVMKAE